jgi:hypothetical protein
MALTLHIATDAERMRAIMVVIEDAGLPFWTNISVFDPHAIFPSVAASERSPAIEEHSPRVAWTENTFVRPVDLLCLRQALDIGPRVSVDEDELTGAVVAPDRFRIGPVDPAVVGNHSSYG